jgi:adenosylcobinamide-phosphate synthase
MDRVVKTLLAALAIDAVIGEPPAPVHPVVWMGHVLNALESRAPRYGQRRLPYGGAAALALPALWGVAAWRLEHYAPWPVQALALKATLSAKCLLAASGRVERSLVAGDLDRARDDLVWLVSRSTQQLDAPLVAAAAIESLAENFVDSYLAPLIAYTMFGLGGAYAYRAINTADAMWGYHSPEYELLGKAAARLDDAVNWLPARIGALLLLLAGQDRPQAFTTWRRDAAMTSSPNAGQTMATAAGQLNVRLEKRDHYVLNERGRSPGPADIAAARRLVLRASILASLLTLALRRLFHR